MAIPTMIPKCNGCGKTPEEFPEYLEAAQSSDLTPDEFVWFEEGTCNPDNGHFLCTGCYVEAGCPTHPGGWVAP